MSRQDQYAAHNVIAAITAERDAAMAAKEAAEQRAKALQGKIDRCVTHIREGQQLRPDEPDAGLEALVVGWVNYHGDCCNFKGRAERAEAQVRDAAVIEDRLFTVLLAAVQSAWPEMMPAMVDEARNLSIELHTALAAVAPSEEDKP